MDLVGIADELYGVLPGEFVKTRTARSREARASGDRELAQDIGELTKPSVSAWVVNQLVRQRAELVEQVLELGEELREAQGSLARDELRELGAQRQQLTAAVAAQGAALGEHLGQRVSAAARAEVQQTMHAAMADPAAADAVRTGRMLRGIASTGLEPADLTDAVALPDETPRGGKRATAPVGRSTASPPRDELKAKRELKEAERRRREAKRRVADAERVAREASRRADKAGDRREDAARRADEAEAHGARLARERDSLQRRLEELQHRLEQLEHEAREADEAASAAGRERSDAEREASEAERAAADAADELRRAREALDGIT